VRTNTRGNGTLFIPENETEEQWLRNHNIIEGWQWYSVSLFVDTWLVDVMRQECLEAGLTPKEDESNASWALCTAAPTSKLRVPLITRIKELWLTLLSSIVMAVKKIVSKKGIAFFLISLQDLRRKVDSARL
jgi:hypothetical protein